MRRPTSAFAKAVLSTALAATTVSAQQAPPMPPPGADPGASAPSLPPMNASRGARYLLRNGWDYITYQEYERALGFFREAESRQIELNDTERLQLKQGIDRAQRGLREASNGVKGEPAYARSGPRRRPGALTLATPAATAPARTPDIEREPIQLAGGGAVAPFNSPPPEPAATVTPIPAATPSPSPAAAASSSEFPSEPAAIPAPPDADPASLPPLASAPAAEPTPAPADLAPPVEPTPAPVPTPAPAPVPAAVAAPTPTPAPAPAETEPGLVLPPFPDEPALPKVNGDAAVAPASTTPAPVETPAPAPAPVASAPAPAPVVEPTPAPVAVASAGPLSTPPPVISDPVLDEASLPPLPSSPAMTPPVETPAPNPLPEPAPAPATAPAPAPEPAPVPEARPTPAPEPPLPPPAETLAPGASSQPVVGVDTPPSTSGGMRKDTLIPERASEYRSTLSPDLQREVDRIAARQEEEMRRSPQPTFNPDPNATPEAAAPSNGTASTRLEISRAPSPTEARPIRAIPVPEEFVPLPKREWDANRKLWSAAATCHLPLYFQDASLERYGYSVEQHFGPFGRFLSVPLDDPRQSKQRNQIAQPFFSIGLFCAQIALLPYNMIVDPPWEAEYDLGYYRPGDRVPTDVYYLPLTGVGPPLKGSNYGNRPNRAAFPPSRW